MLLGETAQFKFHTFGFACLLDKLLFIIQANLLANLILHNIRLIWIWTCLVFLIFSSLSPFFPSLFPLLSSLFFLPSKPSSLFPLFPSSLLLFFLMELQSTNVNNFRTGGANIWTQTSNLLLQLSSIQYYASNSMHSRKTKQSMWRQWSPKLTMWAYEEFPVEFTRKFQFLTLKTWLIGFLRAALMSNRVYLEVTPHTNFWIAK